MTHSNVGSRLLQFLQLFLAHFPLNVRFVLCRPIWALQSLPHARFLENVIPAQAPSFFFEYKLLKSSNDTSFYHPHLDDEAPLSVVGFECLALLLS